MNPWAIAIGAALGALKTNQEEKAAHEERGIESGKTRWATFTGQQGRNVQSPSLMGNMMQGAATGAMMGQMAGGGEAAAGAAGAEGATAAGTNASMAANASTVAPAANMYANPNMFNQQMVQQYPWLRS